MRSAILAAALCVAVFASSVRGEAPTDAAIELVDRVRKLEAEGRWDDAFALYREEDVREIQGLIAQAWDIAEPAGFGAQAEEQFPDWTRETFAAATPKEIFPTLAKRLQSDGTTVGAVVDGDTTHVVVTRSGGAAPDLIPVYKTEGGELRRGSSASDRATQRHMLLVLKLHKAGASAAEKERTLALLRPTDVKVLAILKGEDRPGQEPPLYFVGRGKVVFEGKPEPSMALAELSEDSPVRALLDPDEPTNLDEERRAKIDAFLQAQTRSKPE